MIEVLDPWYNFINNRSISAMLVCFPTDYNIPDTMGSIILVLEGYHMLVPHREINMVLSW